MTLKTISKSWSIITKWKTNFEITMRCTSWTQENTLNICQHEPYRLPYKIRKEWGTSISLVLCKKLELTQASGWWQSQSEASNKTNFSLFNKIIAKKQWDLASIQSYMHQRRLVMRCTTKLSTSLARKYDHPLKFSQYSCLILNCTPTSKVMPQRRLEYWAHHL